MNLIETLTKEQLKANVPTSESVTVFAFTTELSEGKLRARVDF